MHTISDHGFIIYENNPRSGYLRLTRIIVNDPYNQLQMGYNVAGSREPFAQNLGNVLLSIRAGDDNKSLPRAVFDSMPGLGTYLYQAKNMPWVPETNVTFTISRRLINALMS